MVVNFFQVDVCRGVRVLPELFLFNFLTGETNEKVEFWRRDRRRRDVRSFNYRLNNFERGWPGPGSRHEQNAGHEYVQAEGQGQG